MDTTFLRPAELAQKLGVNLDDVRSWATMPDFPFVGEIYGDTFIDIARVVLWIERLQKGPLDAYGDYTLAEARAYAQANLMAA